MHKHPLRRMGAAILSLALAASLAVPAAAVTGSRPIQANYTDIKVMLDGEFLVLTDANGKTVEPFAVDGTTYLPVRAVAGALGLGVEWLAETSTVALTSGGEKTTKTTQDPAKGRTINIGLSADYADIKVTLDGKPLTLTDASGKTVEPFAVDGTTYLPIRAISNALGLEVGWNAENHVVTLSTEPFEITDEIAVTYVQGLLNALYLGQYDQAYLDLVSGTKESAEAAHLTNVMAEAQLFSDFSGITGTTEEETFDKLDPEISNQLMTLFQTIYSKSKFTVSNPKALENGDYTVDVTVSPINVLQLFDTAYDSVSAQFHVNYPDSFFATATPAQYDAYCVAYARMVLDLLRTQVEKLDYLPEQTVTFRVEKNTNAAFTANTEDLNAVDQLIILAPEAR